jgi:AbrB family looped-hinge helix DNA binding protein
METVVSTKGQVVIPKQLREQWGLATGTRVRVTSTAAGIQLTPVLARDAKAVRKGLGLAGYKGPRIAIEDMDPLKALDPQE